MTLFPYRKIADPSCLGLADVLNLAKCAVQRCEGAVGRSGDRFYEEYMSALLWSDVAASFNLFRFS
jgi:hypothetical protein